MNRRVLSLTLLLTLFSGCSYPIEFVVVNEAPNPMVLRYAARTSRGAYPGALQRPAVIPVSQMSSRGGNEWREMATEEYQADQDMKTITVRIPAGSAVRVAYLSDYRESDSWEATAFPLGEIAVSGGSGELKLSGQQGRQAFTRESTAFYRLVYK